MALTSALGAAILFALNGRPHWHSKVRWSYWLRFCAHVLLIYLAWTGVLLYRQKTPPFLGLAASLSGAIFLWISAQRHIRSRLSPFHAPEAAH